jgi:PKD repeat protein
MKGQRQLFPAFVLVMSACLFHGKANAQCGLTLISASHDCTPATAIFKRTDKSGKKIKSVAWDFGDASTLSDTSTVMSHVYQSGDYIVKAVATYSDGSKCTSVLPKKLIVYPPPKAAINLPSIFPYSSTQCFKRDGKPNIFDFTESSISGGSGAPVTNFFWNFGDGSTSALQSPGHSYQFPGQYTVSLKVTDTNGCTNLAIANKPIVVLKDINTKFSYNSRLSCNSSVVSFKDITDTVGLGIKSWVWDFGDGSPTNSSVYNPDHNYGPGYYVITLTIQNELGCTASDRNLVYVSKFEIKTFYTDTVCWSEARDKGVTFNADQQPNVVFWQWDFGDPASGTQNNANFKWTANHKFAGGPGNYKVRFKMKNANPKCGTLDTCIILHVKGPMAMINLPAATFPANNYVAAQPIPKTDFTAISNNPNTCGLQTITYATFSYKNNVRHVTYKYCHAPVLSRTVDTIADCYGGQKMPFISSITLKPTDSTVAVYKDSFETKTTWTNGDKVPAGVVYYPSKGNLVWNNMHDSNLATCKLPNLVRFTNNSIKYRLKIQPDDNTYQNVKDPVHSYRDTCVWKNYPMASDSLVYFWKFNDPSGKPCTSTNANRDWDCNFSSLAAPYHYYKGKNGLPASGNQNVNLTVTDTVMHCADSTVLQLKQGAPKAYWDKSAYCKMNWDMQNTFLSTSGHPSSLVPRIGFQLSGQPISCAGSSYHFKIDFGQTIPLGDAQHWWITFDSAHTTTINKCKNANYSDYGFSGAPGLGYTPGKNSYPAAGPGAFWAGLPWAGNYWYENGDTGCKTIGIVLQNGNCYDTAWYHDYICFSVIDPSFAIYNVLPSIPTKGNPGSESIIDNSGTSTHGHVCQSGTGEGVRIRLYPHNTGQKNINAFKYNVQRRSFYQGPGNSGSSWYYSLPFWPDSASLMQGNDTAFTTWGDTIKQVKYQVYYIDTPHVYILPGVNGLPARQPLGNFPFSKNEIDSIKARNHVNIPISDPRARSISALCGKGFVTVYADKTILKNSSPVLDLSGLGAIDSLTLPYPGFYTITGKATNLQGCVATSQYHLIYGHFATFTTKNDSVVCLGQKVNFDYYVRYWSTHCSPDPLYVFTPTGCLNGSDEVDGLDPNIDFNPWGHADPTTYRDSLTGGAFSKTAPPAYKPEQIFWNFGDDKIFYKIQTGAKTEHIYAKPGVYSVTMRTIDWRGCMVNTRRQNLVKVVQPVVDFTILDNKDTLNSCPSKPIGFKVDAKLLGAAWLEKVIKNGLIVDSLFVVDHIASYTWTTGDGRTIILPTSDTFTVNYFTSDSFTVGLRIQTDLGCTAIKTRVKYVKITDAAPNAHWKVAIDNYGKAKFTNDDLTSHNYSWDFGNSDIADIKNPVYTYATDGKYIVRCIAVKESGCMGEYDSTIYIHIRTSGIDEIDEKLSRLAIFPNPFQASTTVAYQLVKPATIKIEIFDVTGKQVGSIITGKQMPGPYQLDINAEKYHLHAGMYLLKFMVDDHVTSRYVLCSGN